MFLVALSVVRLNGIFPAISPGFLVHVCKHDHTGEGVQLGEALGSANSLPGRGGGLRTRATPPQNAIHTAGGSWTKTMTAAWPHHACVRPSGARQHRATRSSCAAASSARSAPLRRQGRHGEQVQGQLCRRALHSRVDDLDAADHLLSEGADLSVREVVTELSRLSQAVPRRTGAAGGDMGGRLADSG